MSSQFHNRLVGTVVLVALGVIFLPDILDGKKDHQEEQFSEIPLRPTVIEQQKADDDMFEVLSAEDAANLARTEANTDMPSSTADDQLAHAVNTLSPKAETAKVEAAKADTAKGNTAKAVTTQSAAVKEQAKPEVKKEAKAEPKKEPPKATAKTEPPKKPEVKTTAVAKAEKPTVATPKAKAAKDETINVVNRSSLKNGFALQLGSFNNATNVKALVAQLRKSGFKAYTVPATPKDGVLTKVFVGPDVSEAKLKKIQAEVETLTRLKGWIVPFNPLES